MEFPYFFRGEPRRVRCDYHASLTSSMGNVTYCVYNVCMSPPGCQGLFNNCSFEPVEVTETEMHDLAFHAWRQSTIDQFIREMVENI